MGDRESRSGELLRFVLRFSEEKDSQHRTRNVGRGNRPNQRRREGKDTCRLDGKKFWLGKDC